ncbi:MAG: SdrD B-like domain-containing protein [Isosphaeraceae bacterium]
MTLKDTAVLACGYYETGTITFTLYQGSTLLDSETMPVSGNGNYTTPAGYTLPTTGTVTGTYQWDASYSGDTNNTSASETNAAAEQVTVSPASPTITTTPSVTSLTLGVSSVTLKDTAVLALGYYETGTITFTLYLGSTKVDTETVPVSGNGNYTTPAGYALPATGTVTGTYQWDASYSGGTNNASASEINAVAERVTVSPASPTITTMPSPTVVPIGTAASLTDTATLAGGWDPSGTITFTLYQGSTKLETETVAVTGNGSYTTPSSYSLSSCVPSGVYQWDASYNADANNNVASDNNDPAEQVTVVSPCCNLQDIHYSVYNPATMTTTTPADLSGDTQQGDIITVTFTVPAGSYDQISLVSYTAPEPFYNADDANLQTVFQSVTQVEAPGTHSLSIALPPNFYQVDFVCGTVITTLGPETTNPNNFYHAQNRYIDGDNGGVNAAGSGVVSVTGEVYNDVNDDGKLDGGDQALGNVTVTLSGTDQFGNSISETAVTNGSGGYSFSGLPFSSSAGYAVSASPPAGFSSGAATVGTVNGVADGSATTCPEGVGGIVLGSSSQTTGTGYNLGLLTSSDLGGGTCSIVVLSASGCGALTLSGSARLTVPGAIVVDSSSSSAICGSGTAALSASIIDAVGGCQKASGEVFSPAPSTGAACLADPLLGLAAPGTSGLANCGSVNLTSGSKTISPGIYNSITVSNNASLTMTAGIYIIKGGGFSVAGSANVSGSGVTIYNAGSNCPSSGGTYGSINWSSTGAFNLNAPTSGTYCGILIFQSRNNAQTMSINVSGKSGSAITGTIYAAAAQLVDGGATPLCGSLIVNLLAVNSGATADSLDTPGGGVAYTPAQVLSAYGISELGAGLATPEGSPAFDGTGQTIAIVDAYDNPEIFQAVDAFDNQFGLTGSGPTLYNEYGPASSFLTVLNQDGQSTSLPGIDPVGPGTDNWEVEESLDVEWAHAVAPGAQIVLVEANSQSLSVQMTAVATAASQPGVSVVSMSWGFAEGQAVCAADEASYDSTFTAPGVTFVAGTGDAGAADPEYPAFSPNVLAVGGTSLNLNADDSYESETGWGYNSAAAGAFIGSGGGISMYEPEPAYQEGVQSTGSRTTPDVSLLADPATGAWIADPYNLGADNPFEVVGGTSLAAPAWAGLIALVDEGRAAAGLASLNSTGPTETQQALYSLPQSDYNMITSGSNGYTASAGYNLVTGLGTPVANLLVADLVAYQGPSTIYAGPTVGTLQNTTLVATGYSAGGSLTSFSVFNAITVPGSALGYSPSPGSAASTISMPPRGTPAADAVASHAVVTPVTASAATVGLSPGSSWQSGPVQAPLASTNSSPQGCASATSAPISITRAPNTRGTHEGASSAAQAAVSTWVDGMTPGGSPATDREILAGLMRCRRGTSLVSDAVLDDLAADAVLSQAQNGNGTMTIPVLPADRGHREPVVGDPPWQPRPLADCTAGMAVLGLATGFWARGTGLLEARKRRSGRLFSRRNST